MNEKAINQLGTALDTAFGRPGFVQFALANLDALNAIAELVKAAQEQAQAAQTAGDG